jgi:hypothetical protein
MTYRIVLIKALNNDTKICDERVSTAYSADEHAVGTYHNSSPG